MASSGFSLSFLLKRRHGPPHIHVAHGSAECKFWLDPITLAANRGMPPNDVRRTERIHSNINTSCWRNIVPSTTTNVEGCRHPGGWSSVWSSSN
ncbi:MAG: DUF4160 domain-containing protein [Casimicrobiaceae bacterium]